MPRKKPTLRLGVYGNFDLNPEKAVESFFDSKLQNEIYMKKPSWDVAREGLQHTAIENEREYVEMSLQQQEIQNQAQLQSKINERRIEEMYKIQDQLRENFISVNDFMKECAEKGTRANNQIAHEVEKQEALSKEISQIQSDLDVLTEFKSKFEVTIKEFQPYEDVFKKVIEESDVFESFDDIMTRCDALMLAQAEIAEREQELIKGIELIRQKMIKSTLEAAQTIVELNNELAELERSYNEAKTETLKWEKTLQSTKDHISENELQTISLVDSIQHLYTLLVTRNGDKAKFKRFDVGNQLDYIKDEMEVLENIIHKAKKKMLKETKSMLGEKGTVQFFKNDDLGSDLGSN